jgi:hypothetical protein
MQLILKDSEIPVTPVSSMYDGVMKAWEQAMVGFERFLAGEPQIVTDGAHRPRFIGLASVSRASSLGQ